MKVDIPNYEEREQAGTQIVIHPWDTWSMDHTLALIIHPMLVQLKKTKHGYPAHLTEERWDKLLDEMIWAFEQKIDEDSESQFYGPMVDNPENILGKDFEWFDEDGLRKHQERMTQGFRLFGRYYENLWD